MKRCFKTVLSLLLVLTLLPMSVMAAEPATLTPAEAAEEVLTEETVYQKMIALKEEYPEGTPWTNDNFYAWNGGIFSGGYGCAGFAFMLSDAAFGNLPARELTENISIDGVRVGDILRVNNDSHSVILLEVHADHVVIAEGNYNNSVHWGRTLSKEEVAAADYILTRYPVAQVHTHTMTKTEAKPATCQAEGNNAYYICSGCGKVYKDEAGTTETTVAAETLAVLPHTYGEVWLNDETDHWQQCEDCGALSEKEAHAFTWVTDKAPTEEAEGVKHEACHCGYKRNENTPIDKLAHTHKNITHHEAVAATCLADGKIAYWTCGECGKLFSDEACTTEITEADLVVKAKGHTIAPVVETPAGCTDAGTAAHYACSGCGTLYADAEGTTETTLEALAVAPTGHSMTQVASKAATCEEPGNISYWACDGCDRVYADKDATIETTLEKVTVEASGHSYDDGKVTAPPTETEPGTRAYTCANCGHVKTETIPALGKSNVTRIYGDNRCMTAFEAADRLKEVLEVDSFDTIILASGNQFADALAGSYLSAVKEAPILLYRKGFEEANRAYIAENLAVGGTVYILGGTAAVPAAMENVLDGFNVKRLQGDNRYQTNLAILKEAGITGDRILVATGMDYADCLAASATGLPILMVNSRLNKLTAEQEAFLKANSGKNLTVIGGTAAVSEKVVEQLKTYGTVDRITGQRREETAVNVAKAFYAGAETVVVAYSRDFPDALCGGPLAYALNCPLLLVNKNTESYAAGYLTAQGITTGYVMGGPAVVSDATVNAVFAD